MKKLIAIALLTFTLDALALTVVNGSTAGATAVYGNGTNTTGYITSSPSVQAITTTQSFVGSLFGSPGTIGQQVPAQASTINGIDYDVWMAGPVLSRYYNTNIYTANRNTYGINTTLPLVNQTTISGAYYSMGAY